MVTVSTRASAALQSGSDTFAPPLSAASSAQTRGWDDGRNARKQSFKLFENESAKHRGIIWFRRRARDRHAACDVPVRGKDMFRFGTGDGDDGRRDVRNPPLDRTPCPAPEQHPDRVGGTGERSGTRPGARSVRICTREHEPAFRRKLPARLAAAARAHRARASHRPCRVRHDREWLRSAGCAIEEPGHPAMLSQEETR